jgi:hypothetical protein
MPLNNDTTRWQTSNADSPSGILDQNFPLCLFCALKKNSASDDIDKYALRADQVDGDFKYQEAPTEPVNARTHWDTVVSP